MRADTTHITPCRRELMLSFLALAVTAPTRSMAQSIAWPDFGPHENFLRLNGLTDTLPDVDGPLDGSAELTIFSEGNHYPVLLPLVFGAFPTWCDESTACHADPARILVVTLPQPMIVEMLVKGGIRMGNAVMRIGRDQRVFPDLIMAGPAPLRRLASGGFVEDRATVFARHRGLGLLLRRDLTDINDIESFHSKVASVVLASESEPGARSQYRATLDALIGTKATAALLARELRDFPGRLGIQHRDVPYAVVNNLAEGGVIFAHLAAYYAQTYPARLRYVAVPGAEAFGQEIAIARVPGRNGSLTDAFERYFLAAARTAYPKAGFSDPNEFGYGAQLSLTGP
jgi:hypothetical protein